MPAIFSDTAAADTNTKYPIQVLTDIEKRCWLGVVKALAKHKNPSGPVRMATIAAGKEVLELPDLDFEVSFSKVQNVNSDNYKVTKDLTDAEQAARPKEDAAVVPPAKYGHQIIEQKLRFLATKEILRAIEKKEEPEDERDKNAYFVIKPYFTVMINFKPTEYDPALDLDDDASPVRAKPANNTDGAGPATDTKVVKYHTRVFTDEQKLLIKGKTLADFKGKKLAELPPLLNQLLENQLGWDDYEENKDWNDADWDGMVRQQHAIKNQLTTQIQPHHVTAQRQRDEYPLINETSQLAHALSTLPGMEEAQEGKKFATEFWAKVVDTNGDDPQSKKILMAVKTGNGNTANIFKISGTLAYNIGVVMNSNNNNFALAGCGRNPTIMEAARNLMKHNTYINPQTGRPGAWADIHKACMEVQKQFENSADPNRFVDIVNFVKEHPDWKTHGEQSHSDVLNEWWHLFQAVDMMETELNGGAAGAQPGTVMKYIIAIRLAFTKIGPATTLSSFKNAGVKPPSKIDPCAKVSIDGQICWMPQNLHQYLLNPTLLEKAKTFVSDPYYSRDHKGNQVYPNGFDHEFQKQLNHHVSTNKGTGQKQHNTKDTPSDGTLKHLDSLMNKMKKEVPWKKGDAKCDKCTGAHKSEHCCQFFPKKGTKGWVRINIPEAYKQTLGRRIADAKKIYADAHP